MDNPSYAILYYSRNNAQVEIFDFFDAYEEAVDHAKYLRMCGELAAVVHIDQLEAYLPGFQL